MSETEPDQIEENKPLNNPEAGPGTFVINACRYLIDSITKLIREFPKKNRSKIIFWVIFAGLTWFAIHKGFSIHAGTSAEKIERNDREAFCSPYISGTNSGSFNCPKISNTIVQAIPRKLTEQFQCLAIVGGSHNTPKSFYTSSKDQLKITQDDLDGCKGDYETACDEEALKKLNVERKEDACRFVSYSYARAYQGRADPANLDPVNNNDIRKDFLRNSIEKYENAKDLTDPKTDRYKVITQAKANIGYIEYCLLHENVTHAKKYLKEADAEGDPDAGPWLATCVGKAQKR